MTLLDDADLSTDLSVWVADFPEFQRSLILDLESNLGNLDAVAQAWTDAAIPDSAPRGGAHGKPRPLLDACRSVIYDKICSNDERHANDRAALQQQLGLKEQGILVGTTQFVSEQLDQAPAYVGPLVAIVLCSIVRATQEVWCRAEAQRRQSGTA